LGKRGGEIIMCGIIGIINGTRKYKFALADVFRDMFFANQLRGVDGAGVFWYEEKANLYGSYKDTDFTSVIENKGVLKGLSDLEKNPFFIGHNRAATRGKVNKDNSHPFDSENVILVHNGTMNYVPKEFDNGTNVDSHAIAKMISAASPEVFIKDSFGAYALVWFDKRTKLLNLMRNKDRPLSLVWIDEACLVVSEAELGVWCATRRGFKVDKVEALTAHHLYQFAPFETTPTITDLTKHAKESFSQIGKQYSYPRSQAEIEYWEDGYPKYQRQTFSGDSSKEDVRKEKRLYLSTSPWEYLEQTHGKIAIAPHNVLDTHSNGNVKLKVGQPIVFQTDQAKNHNNLLDIIGNLPNAPIKTYQVRGNMGITMKEFAENTNLLRGTITQINERAGKYDIWVRDIEFTDIPDPEFASIVEEVEKKSRG
jgi:predicted glutamine amidotransferase